MSPTISHATAAYQPTDKFPNYPRNTTISDRYDLSVHPVCAYLPMMNGAALERLASDIEKRGLLQPIVMHAGQIVDGRHRLLACRQAHIEPRFVEWRDIYDGPDSIPRWIWSINCARRHMTVDQLVAVEVAIQSWEKEQEAKQRKLEAGKQQGHHGVEGGRGHSKPLKTISSEGVSKRKPAPQVRTQIANDLGVSEHRVQQALIVQHNDPELLKSVVQGKVTLLAAAKKVAKPKPTPRTLIGERIVVQTVAPLPALESIICEIVRFAETKIDKLNDEQRRMVLTEVCQTLEKIR